MQRIRKVGKANFGLIVRIVVLPLILALNHSVEGGSWE